MLNLFILSGFAADSVQCYFGLTTPKKEVSFGATSQCLFTQSALLVYYVCVGPGEHDWFFTGIENSTLGFSIFHNIRKKNRKRKQIKLSLYAWILGFLKPPVWKAPKKPLPLRWDSYNKRIFTDLIFTMQ